MKLTADTTEMRNASQKLKEMSEEYTALYTRLMNTASNMGEAWKAPDNLAFVEQINGFCEELKQMTDHIMQSSMALEQQAVNYETTVENNVTGVKKLVN
ncbi:MAG: WXG100 family type VII secretion target [Ruminiclostridium sp.]